MPSQIAHLAKKSALLYSRKLLQLVLYSQQIACHFVFCYICNVQTTNLCKADDRKRTSSLLDGIAIWKTI